MIFVPRAETDITTACNLCCVNCDHFSPYMPPIFIPTAQIERDVNNAAKIFHTTVFRIVGGEPTLAPHLLDVIDVVHASGVADYVEVLSNGHSLRHMPEAFWQKIDSLWITRYPGIISYEDMQWIDKTLKDHGKGLLLKDRPGFCKTFSTRRASEQETQERFEHCRLTRIFAITDGFLCLCCIAPFISSLVMGAPAGVDGLELAVATEADLLDYMDRKNALPGCAQCIEFKGLQIPFRQVTRATWFDESKSNL